ncbi:PPE family protein [Mycobacterium sp. 94-17]|uniref:PPE family protein n=1 Tax=Mycobacterium sp. 94-17 TaxID=2986147 RepID=UPI002D1EF8FA|nr:PPE family protein [Mycobacterium sp. 94-17]MEB4209430.1 PPE family protein [Mycobacterium sp. 94-17]
MDFGILPPEINSARMYSGPGSGPMLAAAAAWDGLAAQLRATAASYSSVISGLTAGWLGPSSTAMAAAAAPYAAWMNTTAAQAEQTAAQARAAAAAYETAFAGTVAPPLIAVNRAELAQLVATNVVGQNTPAIAAVEAQYADMWAQDAATMYGYAGESASAAQVTPFTPAPQTTNPDGPAAQSATATQTAGTSARTGAQSMLSQLTSQPLAAPSSPQPFAAPAATDPSTLPSSLASLNTTPLGTALRLFEFVSPASLPGRNALVSSTLGFGLLTRGFNTGEVPVPLVPGVLYNPTAVAAGSVSAVSLGEASTVGALSVPPSWAAATPAVRLAATVLQGTGQAAVPLAAVESGGNMFGQMALAGLAGGAAGGAVARASAKTPAREEGSRSADSKDSAGKDKESKTSEKLTRVLAEISAEPESVQHWHTDKAHLDGLLAQLSTKPGVHAVHVSSRHQPDPPPPRPRWG